MYNRWLFFQKALSGKNLQKSKGGFLVGIFKGGLAHIFFSISRIVWQKFFFGMRWLSNPDRHIILVVKFYTMLFDFLAVSFFLGHFISFAGAFKCNWTLFSLDFYNQLNIRSRWQQLARAGKSYSFIVGIISLCCKIRLYFFDSWLYQFVQSFMD